MSRVKPAVLAVLAVVVGLLMLATPAGAQDNAFTIQVEGVLTGNEGDVVSVVSQPVDAALVGATCNVVGASENNSSVHPGNDLIIATGDTTTTVPGVEDAPGLVINGSGSVVLGASVDISLRFGPDGVTSGGTTLTFDCAPAGAVDTGAGGTAGSTDNGLMLLALGAVAVAAAGALVGWKRYTPNA